MTNASTFYGVKLKYITIVCRRLFCALFEYVALVLAVLTMKLDIFIHYLFQNFSPGFFSSLKTEKHNTDNYFLCLSV